MAERRHTPMHPARLRAKFCWPKKIAQINPAATRRIAAEIECSDHVPRGETRAAGFPTGLIQRRVA